MYYRGIPTVNIHENQIYGVKLYLIKYIKYRVIQI